MTTKADILAQLKKDILLWQGFKPSTYGAADAAGLDIIRAAFPNGSFPVGAMHEFFCTGAEDASSTAGFIAGILSALNRNSGPSIWISSSPVFPPALKWFGLEPHKIIFIDLKKEKEKLWAMEEALRCDGLSSVVADISEISFTESRRLQLAVEQTRVTGFLLRRNPKNLSTSCVTRWKVAPLAAAPRSDLPGVGLPGWNVSLLKVRNGQPGSWQMQWSNGRFTLVQAPAVIIRPLQRKIV